VTGGSRRIVRSSELFELLESDEESGGIRQLLAADMPEFRAGLERRGSVAPVRLRTEGIDLPISEPHVRRICEEYLAGRLDEQEVEYVATALELCPDFRMVSEAVEELVFRLSSPAANGPLSREVVEAILRSL
jgi:hypothetical protein